VVRNRDLKGCRDAGGIVLTGATTTTIKYKDQQETINLTEK
jgi:hypothetical protein